MRCAWLAFFGLIVVSACASSESPWRLMLQHDAGGAVVDGSVERVVAAVEAGMLGQYRLGERVMRSARDQRRS